MHFSKSVCSDGRKKIIRLKKKGVFRDLKIETERDFLLEGSEDVTNFLSPIGQNTVCAKITNGKILPYNVIGSYSVFSAQYEAETKNRFIRRLTNSNSIKQPKIRQSILHTKIDPKTRFNDVMKRINDACMRSEQEEKDKEKFLTETQLQKHRLLYQNIQKLEGKSTKSIESPDKFLLKTPTSSRNSSLFGLKKVRKESNSCFDLGNNLIWYMSLRKNQKSEHLDSYMCVGNEINGLYTKVKKPNPYFKAEKKLIDSMTEENYKDLEIIGVNKLALEVEAVKKVGYEYLRPELLSYNKTRCQDEIIIEHYDNF
ncbi:hypothetical protein SteCoe_10807 [Stentor coeruleus]|uniref:Uncharacterized protein n=1 Tax=Stentor coeruleus TaxID=5963 RepID=A0A1R2CEM4_9CILI|nr:hypothetical protein SteCoe_10807 [Stentor coeruleus]